MRKKANRGVWKIRSPERDCAILVSEMYYGIVRVLAHRMARSKLGSMFNDELACRSILILQVAGIALVLP